MTRKDYELIAGCLRRFRNRASLISEGYHAVLLDEFVANLKDDNPNFNADKFIRAVVGEE